MLNVCNVDLALIKVISPVFKDNGVTESFYYNEDNIMYEWKIVELKYILSYAVIVESLRYSSRLYISW